MSKENDVIETAKTKAQRDSHRKYALSNDLQNVNDPLECVLLLGRLNEAIDTLCALQDEYYTNYIWNSSTRVDDALKKEGFNEELFYDMECKLSKLREILMGDSMNWEETYQRMYLNVLGHEVYWKEFYEEKATKLQNEMARMERNKK